MYMYAYIYIYIYIYIFIYMYTYIFIYVFILFLHAERLTIIGDFGVQWNFRRLFGASSRFVAMSQIQDVFISEV